jgi:hypothetical protein
VVSLAADDFYLTALAQLEAAGYLVTVVQRYDPTVLRGTSPKGVACSFTVSDGGWTATYRNRTLTGPADPDWWLPGSVVQRFLDTLNNAGG